MSEIGSISRLQGHRTFTLSNYGRFCRELSPMRSHGFPTDGVAFQMRIHTEWSNRPATFIVDKEGMLRYAHRARSFADRPGADEIISELRKLE